MHRGSGQVCLTGALRDGIAVGFALANAVHAPPSFGSPETPPSCELDDFTVAPTERWDRCGRMLLEEVALEAARRGLQQLVVVCPKRDTTKRAMLIDAGLDLSAEWWVKPLEPRPASEQPIPTGGEVVLGPAPPVYDPGGPVGVVLRLNEPDLIDEIEEWLETRGAVLSIVPAWTRNQRLRSTFGSRDDEPASEWFRWAY